MIPIPLGGPSNGEGSIITQEHQAHPLSDPPPAIAILRSQGGETTNEIRKSVTFNDENHNTPRNRIRAHWADFKERLGGGGAFPERLIEITENSAASEIAGRRYVTGKDNNGDPTDDEEVDEIFVDNRTTQPSEMNAQALEKSDSNSILSASEENVPEPTGVMGVAQKIEWFYHRVRPRWKMFFFTSFHDPASEERYVKETYYRGKGMAILGCGVILLHWILGCIPIIKENTITPDKMFYYIVCPCLAVPLAPMVVSHCPYRFPRFYQLFLAFSIWSWAAYSLILLRICGYSSPAAATMECPGREFVGIFYYTIAFPVIGLFVLYQNRLVAVIQALFTAPLLAVVIRNRQTAILYTLNFCVWTILLVWLHFEKEITERKSYTLQKRLKGQYSATHAAKVREGRTANWKRRTSDRLFREVRTPLSAAILALQNVQASGLLEPVSIEATALKESLTMMSKTVDDALHFNHMTSGGFESSSKPYAFHEVINSTLVPLQEVASVRGLHLTIELDEQIDRVSKLMLNKALAEAAASYTNQSSEKKLLVGGKDVAMAAGGLPVVRSGDVDDEVALVVGDENLLRQVVTNLTSNACNFTPTGGRIWVRTKLVSPDKYDPLHPASSEPPPSSVISDTTVHPGTEEPFSLSAQRFDMQNTLPAMTPVPERIVIRIEVEDTGVGIRNEDVDNIFSPYVQADIRRSQGGKGTGLGLAVSQNLVRLSGGRMGVKSKRNQGSMFWVELWVEVGRKVLEMQDLIDRDGFVA